MTETSFASLSPTLLARKGGAKPAMRPQIAPLDDKGSNLAANLEDLGWNDMGDDGSESYAAPSPAVGLTPEPVREEIPAERAPAPQPTAVREQIADLASRIATNDRASGDRASDDRASDDRASNDSAPNDSAPNDSGDPTAPAAPRRSAVSRGKRAAFTLRLDAARHLKLRLASTVKGRSAQALVTDALDAMLAEMPELDSMAAHVSRK